MRFLLTWMAANLLGYGLLVIFVSLQISTQGYFSIVLIPAWGLIIAALQAAALRQKIHIFRAWLWASTWAIVVFGISISLASHIDAVFLPVLIYLLGLMVLQYLALRKRLKFSWVWLPTSLVAIFFNLLAVLFIAGLSRDNLSIAPISHVLFPICAIAVYGLLTGMTLTWLLRNPVKQSRDKASSSNRRDLPPNNHTWFQVISTVISIGVFLAWTVLVLTRFQLEQNLPPFAFPLFLLGFLAYNYVSILVHELGHLSLALMGGFKFNFLAVGRWVWLHSDRGIQLKRFQKLAAGGATSTLPSSTRHLKVRLLRKVFGGPLASFLLFLIGPTLFLFPQTVNHSPVLMALVIYSGFNLGLTILNLLPLRAGHFQTDGSVMVNILRNTPFGQQFVAMYRAYAYFAQGLRPKELDHGLLQKLLTPKGQSMFYVNGQLMSYYHALDQGHLEQAGVCLDEALTLKAFTPEFYRSTLLLEGAYFEAQIRHNPEAAQALWDEIQEWALVPAHTKLRAEAAIQLAQSEYDIALTLAQQGLNQRPTRSLQPGMVKMETDCLEQLRDRAQMKLAGSA